MGIRLLRPSLTLVLDVSSCDCAAWDVSGRRRPRSSISALSLSVTVSSTEVVSVLASRGKLYLVIEMAFVLTLSLVVISSSVSVGAVYAGDIAIRALRARVV